MKDQFTPHQIIAKAIRVEHNLQNDSLCLVFEVTDEKFKQEIKQDWMQDLEVKILGRSLIKV